MMMTTINPNFTANLFASLNATAGLQYTSSTTAPSLLAQQVLGGNNGNYFPVFGNTVDGYPSPFAGVNNGINPTYFNQQPNCFPYPPAASEGNNWTTLLGLVLGKLLFRRSPSVTDTTTTEPTVVIHRSKPTDNDNIVVNTTTAMPHYKKATLPEDVSPLSYHALQTDSAYYDKAKDALVKWQRYLTTYETGLDNRHKRNKWIEGAVTYLALLNDPKVRDLFLTDAPRTIGTYYKNVLRTFHNNKHVRRAMEENPNNARILEVLDNTNIATSNHRIFKES
jgi:hypothetical protein